MSDAFTRIPAPASGGSVKLSVAAPHYPHPFAGIVWEFDSDQKRIGDAREVSSLAPSLSLGSPAVIDKHYFFLEGRVLNSGDDPPTPYLIEVTESQAGADLRTEVPSNGGSGQIGKSDVPFTYTFQIVATSP